MNLLLDIVSGEDDGQCTYEEKWNEDMLVDSLLVYPWILVKHRETLFSGEVCQDYNPTLMTKYYPITLVIILHCSILTINPLHYCN